METKTETRYKLVRSKFSTSTVTLSRACRLAGEPMFNYGTLGSAASAARIVEDANPGLRIGVESYSMVVYFAREEVA